MNKRFKMVYRRGQIINIAGTTPVNDPEYRYKMPAVFGKIEGSGNGIKTVIPNISAVGASLRRSPAEVNKFFGTELGAATRYSPDTDRAIVNGAHADANLQDLVHRYIEKFVLCPLCDNNPETEYEIKKDCIYLSCRACGAMEMVDMNHKLCNFILAEDKKAKNKAKANGKKKKSKQDSDEGKKKAKKEKKKDKKDSENGDKDYIKEALVGGKKFDDDDFGEQSETDKSDNSEADFDDDVALQLAVDATMKFLKETPVFSDAELIEMVTNQQMASALKSHDKVPILVRAAFTSQFFKNKEIEKFASAIICITNNNRIMERHLIAALEAVCVDKPKNYPVMIKQLYDADALEEDTILEWANEGRSTYTTVDEGTRAILRGEAEPVVVWLQDSDSEEESGEEN